MPTPQVTLLLLTRSLLVRADFRGGKLAAVFQQPPSDLTDSFPVEAALALGPEVGRVVWVLAESVWTQTLNLSAAASQGLTGPELEQALSFEVEPLSGVSAQESRLAVVPLAQIGGQRPFWVSQLRIADFGRAEAAVRQAGGRLAGVLHPGGLDTPFTLQPSAPWQRVELWADSVVCVFSEPGRPVARLVLNADPAQNRWVGQLDQWRATERAAARREMRLANGEVLTFADDGSEETAIGGEPALEMFLTAWAKSLAGKPVVPILRPIRAPIGPSLQRVAAVGLFLAAAAGCAWHYTTYAAQRGQLAATLAEWNSRYAQAQTLKNDRQLLEAEQKNLQKSVAALSQKLDRCSQGLAAHRRRKSDLLLLLAKHRPNDLIIQKIDAEASEPCIRGLCLQPADANRYAADLAHRLRELSWAVGPPKLEAQGRLDNGGPWVFEIRLRDIVPPGMVPPPPLNNGD